ncbi:MAG: MXAN_6577-like cysteine-rich protein [Myxococcota bacterium]|nr:MXAN_6577-like cysteine-rich protein [Myxococcota bacterium]
MKSITARCTPMSALTLFFSFSHDQKPLRRSLRWIFSLSLGLLLSLGCSSDTEPPQCPAGQLLCGDFCVLAQDDSQNCGACGNVCAAGELCVSGSCESPDAACAMPGQALCDGACVDTNTDQSHCGGCGRSCGGSAFCAAGSCMCDGGQSFCGAEIGCVNLNASPIHCGACGNGCQPGQLCNQGICSNPQGEVCDGMDNDLDGVVDEAEGGGSLTQLCSNGCGEGSETCSDGIFVNCSAPRESVEVCDETDNDCDGIVDEGVATRYYADRDSDGFGSLDASTAIFSCEAPGLGYSAESGDCDDQDQQSFPGALERCDGYDNNCDGNIDEGCECTNGEIVDCGSDIGLCRPGTQICDGGTLSACGGGDYVAAEATDRCDGLDNDCDERVDEENDVDAREGGGNQRCAQASPLQPLREGGSARISNLSLYQPNGAQDSDWYSILAEENGLDLGDLGCIQSLEQCFYLGFTFSLPEDIAQGQIEACVYPVANRGNGCSANNEAYCTSPGSYNVESHSYSFGLRWDGNCALQDSREFKVEVRAAEGQSVNSCQPYEMSFRFDKIDRSECD